MIINFFSLKIILEKNSMSSNFINLNKCEKTLMEEINTFKIMNAFSLVDFLFLFTNNMKTSLLLFSLFFKEKIIRFNLFNFLKIDILSFYVIYLFHLFYLFVYSFSSSFKSGSSLNLQKGQLLFSKYANSYSSF